VYAAGMEHLLAARCVLIERTPPSLLFSAAHLPPFCCFLCLLTFNLHAAHLTGMDHLLAAPSIVNEGSPAMVLFSAGKSGSVKRWKLRLSHVMKKLGVDGECGFITRTVVTVITVTTTCTLSCARLAA
jgi:hypothetical protein